MSGPEFTPGGTWHMKADPPTTAAGRALLADNGPRVETGDHDMARRILAIEAEARAAALDEARAAVEGAMSNDGWQRKVNVLAAIDALREDADKP